MGITGHCAALVPARDFYSGKSRLAVILNEETRAALSRWMLERVLHTLKTVEQIDEIAVLSDGAEVLALGESLGTTSIRCPARDMNADLEIGREWALNRGAHWLLIVHGDLPSLKPSDVEAMLDIASEDRGRSKGCAILAGSKDGGTNGLLLNPPNALPFSFGPKSLKQHLETAAANQLHVERLKRPGFALDLDTPSDLAALLETDVSTPEWLSALSPS